MRPLFLTINPNLTSTTRVLQSWLLLGRQQGMEGCVAVQSEGPFARWLQSHGFAYCVDSMPWPDRRRPWQTIRAGTRLWRWCRRHRIDLIHCNEHNIYPFGQLLARSTWLPVVCHVRCKMEAGFARWAFGKRQPDALIWCTRAMRDEGAEMLGGCVESQRQHVVYLGVDARNFEREPLGGQRLRTDLGILPQITLVGMASAIRPGKRIEDYLEIAKHFQGRPDVQFVFAGGPVPGDEAYFEHVEPRLRQADAGGVIRWLGHVEAIESFMQAIDVFVSTSEHESFGMSVCEAMACSRPVAAYAACSVAEVVGDAGLIVNTGDQSGLLRAVERLTADPELRQSLGKAARERIAQSFDPAISLRQIQRVYTSLGCPQ